MSVLADMEWARKAFKEIVWPRAKTLLLPCELICVEGTELDLKRATDYLMVREDGSQIPLACRIQKVRSSYNSFTVRYNRETGAITEFQKLFSGPGPAFHLHAYVRYDDAFLSVGVMRTANLKAAIEEMDIEVRRNREGRGDADFIPVWWDALMKLHEVRIIRDTPPWIDDTLLRKLEAEHKNRPRFNKLDLSFVGYDPNGRFLHYCHCGEWGAFGHGVDLPNGILGTWYCAEHQPED